MQYNKKLFVTAAVAMIVSAAGMSTAMGGVSEPVFGLEAAQVAGESISNESSAYLIQPGDILTISVWKEKDLQGEVVVRPDGGISFPLIGEVQTQGKSINQLRKEITERIHKYVPDVDVMVAAKQLQGNKVYVIGKVNRSGEFPMNRNLDVMQALSIAGGTTQFADVDNIIILRRSSSGQQVFEFDYNEVERGKNLQQNILLNSGDVVVVP